MKFLLGLTVGTVLAMLFAPARGEETREKLGYKVREMAQGSEQKLQEKAGELGAKVGREAAQAAVATVTNKLVPGTDEKQAQAR